MQKKNRDAKINYEAILDLSHIRGNGTLQREAPRFREAAIIALLLSDVLCIRRVLFALCIVINRFALKFGRRLVLRSKELGYYMS